jgi:hypothetical protein
MAASAACREIRSRQTRQPDILAISIAWPCRCDIFFIWRCACWPCETQDPQPGGGGSGVLWEESMGKTALFCGGQRNKGVIILHRQTGGVWNKRRDFICEQLCEVFFGKNELSACEIVRRRAAWLAESGSFSQFSCITDRRQNKDRDEPTCAILVSYGVHSLGSDTSGSQVAESKMVLGKDLAVVETPSPRDKPDCAPADQVLRILQERLCGWSGRSPATPAGIGTLALIGPQPRIAGRTPVLGQQTTDCIPSPRC